jgi:hypothetical protein
VKIGDLVKIRTRPWYGIITETLNNNRDIHVVWMDNVGYPGNQHRLTGEWIYRRELEVISESR